MRKDGIIANILEHQGGRDMTGRRFVPISVWKFFVEFHKFRLVDTANANPQGRRYLSLSWRPIVVLLVVQGFNIFYALIAPTSSFKTKKISCSTRWELWPSSSNLQKLLVASPKTLQSQQDFCYLLLLLSTQLLILAYNFNTVSLPLSPPSICHSPISHSKLTSIQYGHSIHTKV